VKDERKRNLMRDHEENNLGNKKRKTLMKTLDERVSI
jgi:hypothetical protein